MDEQELQNQTQKNSLEKLPRYDEERATKASKMFTYTEFNSEANTTCIAITEGKFKDVVYFYKRIQVGEGLDQGQAPLTFEYTIKSVPETIEPEKLTVEDHKEFEILIGDILVKIIEESLEPEINELRKDDPQSPSV